MGILLESATEPIDNTAAGKLTENMFATIAQFENDLKSEYSTSSAKNRLEHGIWPWKAPLGYINVRNSHNKADVAQIDIEASHHIVNIFHWYASGKMGIVEISKAIQGNGLVHKKGKFKGKAIKFSPQTVHNILINKFYVGILYVKKWDEQYEGAHKPLIDVKTWEACQARLYPPKEAPMTRKHINPEFPLKDNLMCGYCTRKMTAAWTQGKMQKYAYYYCTHTDCLNPGKKAVGKIDFENQFMDYLNNLKPNKEIQKVINDKLLVRYRERQNEFETDASIQRKRLDQLESQKQNLVEAIAVGADKADMLPAIAKIKEEIALVKLALNESHAGEFEMDLMLTYAETFFSRMALLWHDAPIKQKVQMQRVLFPDGIIYSYGEGGFSNTKLRPYISFIEAKRSDVSINVTPQGIEPWFTG